MVFYETAKRLVEIILGYFLTPTTETAMATQRYSTIFI